MKSTNFRHNRLLNVPIIGQPLGSGVTASPDGVIENGHHRVAAAQALGINGAPKFDTDALLIEAAAQVKDYCKGMPANVVAVLELYGYLKPFTSINPQNITYAVTPVVGKHAFKSMVDIPTTNGVSIRVHTGSPTYSGNGRGTRVVAWDYR